MSRIFTFLGRSLYVGLKILGVLLVLATLFTGFVFWQVSQKPIDLEFAREAIETALYDEETGNYVRIDKTILYWPDFRGPLLLGLENAKLINKGGEVIMSVDQAALSFARAPLLIGRLMPKTIILKKPSLRIIRSEDNQIDFGFGGKENEKAIAENEAIITRILGYIARPGKEAAKNSIISRLEAFEIEDAQLMVEDRKLGITWFLPHFSSGFFSTNAGLKANFDVTLPEVNAKPSGFTINLDYIWDTKKSIVKADIENLDTMILSGKLPELEIFRDQNIVLDAHLNAALDENFLPQSLTFNLTSPQGTIAHPQLSERPLPYKDLSASAIYDTASNTLIIDNTNITLSDVTMRLKGDIKREEGKISGPVKLEIYDVAQSQIGPLWPAALKGDNAEEWIVHKMSKGRFQNVWVGADLLALHQPEQGWTFDAGNIQAGFGIKDMDLDYRAPMLPLTGASGEGTFDMAKDEMKITVAGGKLGGLVIGGAELLFDRLIEPGVGGVTIDVGLAGTMQDVLRYLEKEPIKLNEKMNTDIDKVKGTAQMKVHLNFPTRKEIGLKDFIIGVEGTAKDVLLPAVLENLDLSGGPFDMSIKDGLFTMKGKGKFDDRDLDLDYAEYLDSDGKDFKSKIKASLTADLNIRTKLGIDLSSFIDGSLPVKVDYTSLNDGTAVADIDVDVGPAVFFVDPFDFTKASGVPATAKFKAHFKDKEIQNISGLTASGEGFELGESKITFMKVNKETVLAGGTMSRFTLGETKGKLNFEIGKDRIAKLVLDADFLDIRPFLDAEETKADYKQLPMKVSVTARKMKTTDKESVRTVEMYIDVDGQGRFNQMEMDALAGSSAIYLRFKPDETGKRVFRFKTADAGAALRAFNIYNNIRGGTMVIYGEPVGGGMDRNLVGKAELTNFKAVKAPILSKLLSILSIPGLIEVMSSDGLSFTKLEADFNWVYKKEGSLLVLKNGRTSGNSLGLTFDGTFDNAKRQVDVEGTVIPMSGINSMIGNIPLVGDILTGGSGSLFAATYSIEGSSENPDIGVNPLSVITPGILRRILFE